MNDISRKTSMTSPSFLILKSSIGQLSLFLLEMLLEMLKW